MDECEMSSVFEDFTDVPICPSVIFFSNWKLIGASKIPPGARCPRSTPDRWLRPQHQIPECLSGLDRMGKPALMLLSRPAQTLPQVFFYLFIYFLFLAFWHHQGVFQWLFCSIVVSLLTLATHTLTGSWFHSGTGWWTDPDWQVTSGTCQWTGPTGNPVTQLDSRSQSWLANDVWGRDLLTS